MSHIRYYQVLPWATGPLTSPESNVEVPDWQVAITGKSSILSQANTIAPEAITTIQMWKNSINHWVLYSPLIVLKERTQTSWRFPHLCLLLYAILFEYNIHSDYVNRSFNWKRVVGMQLQFILSSWQLTLESQTVANCYFRTEVGVLVLDFTRNAVAVNESVHEDSHAEHVQFATAAVSTPFRT